jgi:hypothetical protein
VNVDILAGSAFFLSRFTRASVIGGGGGRVAFGSPRRLERGGTSRRGAAPRAQSCTTKHVDRHLLPPPEPEGRFATAFEPLPDIARAQ